MIKQTSFTLSGIAVVLGIALDNSSAPQNNAYTTAPGANIAANAPLGSFSFGEDPGSLDVPPGESRVHVTVPNEPGVVVFYQGALSVDGGLNLAILAAVNTTPKFVAFTPESAAESYG